MKKLILVSLLAALMLSSVIAQEVPEPAPDPSKNFIKLNLTSIPLMNFSLQYERVLSRSVSAALSFSYMPEDNIPNFLADQAIEQANNMSDEGIDPETEDIIRSILISSYTVTPEVRFYLGQKRYSTGFYISLFYRYGSHSVSNIPIPFTNDNDDEITIDTKGDIKSHTGGFLLGYQWALGKHMCLDWQMFGPHFGVHSGDFLGLPSTDLSSQDQATIEEEFLNVESELINQTVDATATEVKMTTDGPWAGLRFAISLGVKF